MAKYTLLNNVVRFAAKYSDDPRLQVGACLVSGKQHTFGTNRFLSIPDGYTKEQLVADRELKLKHITHAEADALLKSNSAEGSTIYVNYTPCIGCAQKIVAAGVKAVVVSKCADEAVALRWKASWQEAIDLFAANGVEYSEQ